MALSFRKNKNKKDKKITAAKSEKTNPEELFGDLDLFKDPDVVEEELPADNSIQIAYDYDGNAWYVSYDLETNQYFDPYSGEVYNMDDLFDENGNPFVFNHDIVTTTNEEISSQQEQQITGEYWEQFIGNPNYGYYDENNEWQWLGYFNDDNTWIPYANSDQQQTLDETSNSQQSVDNNINVEQQEISASANNVDDNQPNLSQDDTNVPYWKQFVGVDGYGYYDENNEWQWLGYFNDDNTWIPYANSDQQQTLDETSNSQQSVDSNINVEQQEISASANNVDDNQPNLSQDDTNVPYWKQFVGVDGYGYYDENNEWQWLGYFNDDNTWIPYANSDQQQTLDETSNSQQSVDSNINVEQQEISASANNVDDNQPNLSQDDTNVPYWKQFVGVDGYGYYDENNEWQWLGYFNDDNTWIPYANSDQQQTLDETSNSQQSVDSNINVEQQEISASANNVDDNQPNLSQDDTNVPYWKQFVGVDGYGYYDENNEWQWLGYFNDDNTWIPYANSDQQQTLDETSNSQQSVDNNINVEQPDYYPIVTENSFNTKLNENVNKQIPIDSTHLTNDNLNSYHVLPLSQNTQQSTTIISDSENMANNSLLEYNYSYANLNNKKQQNLNSSMSNVNNQFKNEELTYHQILPTSNSIQSIPIVSENIIENNYHIPEYSYSSIKPKHNYDNVNSTNVQLTNSQNLDINQNVNVLPNIDHTQISNNFIQTNKKQNQTQLISSVSEVNFPVFKNKLNKNNKLSNNDTYRFVRTEPMIIFSPKVSDNQFSTQQLKQDDLPKVINDENLTSTPNIELIQEDVKSVVLEPNNVNLFKQKFDSSKQQITKEQIDLFKNEKNVFNEYAKVESVNDLTSTDEIGLDTLSSSSFIGKLKEIDVFESKNYDQTLKVSLADMFNFINKSRDKSTSIYNRIVSEIRSEINHLTRNVEKLTIEYKENEQQIAKFRSDLMRSIFPSNNNLINDESSSIRNPSIRDMDSLQHIQEYNKHIAKTLKDNKQRLDMLQKNLRNIKTMYETRMVRINNDNNKLRRLVTGLAANAAQRDMINLLESSFDSIRKQQNKFQYDLNNFDPIVYEGIMGPPSASSLIPYQNIRNNSNTMDFNWLEDYDDAIDDISFEMDRVFDDTSPRYYDSYLDFDDSTINSYDVLDLPSFNKKHNTYDILNSSNSSLFNKKNRKISSLPSFKSRVKPSTSRRILSNTSRFADLDNDFEILKPDRTSNYDDFINSDSDFEFDNFTSEI